MAEITVMASITIQEADELVTKLLDAIDEATKNEF